MTAHNCGPGAGGRGFKNGCGRVAEADDRGHREQLYVVRPAHCFDRQQWLCQPPLVAVRVDQALVDPLCEEKVR